jgi:hypothetical protein
MAPSNAALPPIPWADTTLNYTSRLIDLIEENDAFRRGVWPIPGDKTIGKPKADTHRQLAEALLGDDPYFRRYICNKEGEQFYGRSIKAQLTKLQSQYKKAAEALGVTGGGLNHEDEILIDSPFWDKWREVRVMCPYFFRLKPLLGERMNVAENTITNSGIEVDMAGLVLARKG